MSARFAIYRSEHNHPMKGRLGKLWEGSDPAEFARITEQELDNTAPGYFIHTVDFAMFGGAGIKSYSPT